MVSEDFCVVCLTLVVMVALLEDFHTFLKGLFDYSIRLLTADIGLEKNDCMGIPNGRDPTVAYRQGFVNQLERFLIAAFTRKV